ncbi:hypothetical protein MHUMG1_08520 [Metarhizium humberi]|uniref:Uncharacterized protein n=1 Tax=Metarhizium humberi TaxID=2596975 RepID=A0A9P8M6L1_9HYPO|nr:hypothetical protein MHUMG1_08520 [Metarhizium humberi]
MRHAAEPKRRSESEMKGRSSLPRRRKLVMPPPSLLPAPRTQEGCSPLFFLEPGPSKPDAVKIQYGPFHRNSRDAQLSMGFSILSGTNFDALNFAPQLAQMRNPGLPGRLTCTCTCSNFALPEPETPSRLPACPLETLGQPPASSNAGQQIIHHAHTDGNGISRAPVLMDGVLDLSTPCQLSSPPHSVGGMFVRFALRLIGVVASK